MVGKLTVLEFQRDLVRSEEGQDFIDFLDVLVDRLTEKDNFVEKDKACLSSHPGENIQSAFESGWVIT